MFTPNELIENEIGKSNDSKDGEKKEYLSFYKDNCNSLDSRTFGEVKRQIKLKLESEECPNEIKMLFGDWFFRKLNMYYKPQKNERRNISSNLVEPITELKNPIIKSSYLKFHNMDTMTDLCEHFYINRFSDHDAYFIIQMLNDVELVKNIRNRTKIEELKQHFIKWLRLSNVYEQKSNLLDSLLREFPNDAEVKKVYTDMKYGTESETKEHTIYTNKQNVHELDKKYIKIAIQLVEDINNGYATDNDVKVLCDKKENWEKIKQVKKKIELSGGISWKEYMSSILFVLFKNTSHKSDKDKSDKDKSDKDKSDKDKRDIIDCVLQRVCVDHQSFGPTKITAATLITCIVEFILNYSKKYIIVRYFDSNIIIKLDDKDYEYSDEAENTLRERLLEEFDEMKELCISGYISRLINVLQGFSKKYSVTIDFKDQLYSVISHKLFKELEKAPDKVVDGTYDPEFRSYYLDFIKDIVNSNISSLIQDYGESDVSDSIVSVLDKLSGSQTEKIVNWTWDGETKKVNYLDD